MSNPIPSSVALTTIAGTIAASPLNSDYVALQTAANGLISALSGGASGQKLEAADATHVQWTYPPGYEYAYNEITSDATSTATTEGAATAAVTASAVTFDGSTAVYIEFYAPAVTHSVSNTGITFALYDGAASVGIIGKKVVITNGFEDAVLFRRRLTPSAATKTYSIRVFSGSGTATVRAGAAGVGANVPASIRIVKA